MPERLPEPMDPAAFHAWQEARAERHELVGGQPVRMQAGARNVHDDIVVNLVAFLRTALRGSGCRPFTGDGSVETLPGQIRRPDVGVDCGRRDPNGLQAAEPRLVVEVLSPTTRDFDAFAKLAEYRRVPSIVHVLLVEPNAPEARLWSRGADGAWAETRAAGLDAALALPGLGAGSGSPGATLTLPLAEIYDGVAFPARPRPVPDPAPDEGRTERGA